MRGDAGGGAVARRAAAAREFAAGRHLYWSRVPLPSGHAFDLAGWQPLPSGRGTEAWVGALLGAPDEAELVIYADPGRGTFRYASLVDGRLDACLFLARKTASLPPRETLAELLGARIAPEERMCLLAGRRPAMP